MINILSVYCDTKLACLYIMLFGAKKSWNVESIFYFFVGREKDL